ncbi:hypothetical protein [Parasporobacterium paucivorans]|uniref:DUF4352 domain-containing protein n=1 Tax=Parasporobacterium paucivorans DSM 15970 TaxID=1122934 RepID=A0A1M6KPT1_9FIRM|nr:hypothetical protein [Parasporobacterium paucivorans]SHJ60854.1 hypothetical protein SAMN02745691_02241 [Parasporobacterium paucivorans DSM 15970]
MKSSNIKIAVLVVLINSTLICGCSNETLDGSTINKELNFELITESTAESIKEETPSEVIDNDEKIPKKGYVINNSNIYSPNEEINIDGIVFSNIEISATKAIPSGISKEEIINFGEKTDEYGSLVEKQTYAFVDLTISNTTQDYIDLYLSGGYLGVLNSENEISDSSVELRYRSNYFSDDPYRKDYYLYRMGPDESKTIKLGYIVSDQLLNSENLNFIINKDGFGPGYDQLKAFKLR